MNTILLLIIICLLAYIPYKLKQYGIKQQKQRSKFSWISAGFIGGWFFGFSLLLNLLDKGIYHVMYLLPLELLFVGSTFLWFYFPYVVRKWGRRPDFYIAQNPTRPFVEFLSPRMLVKYFEIIFQQSVLLYLLFAVLGKFSVEQQLLWFTIVVVGVHLVNSLFLDLHEAIVFSLLSIFMGGVFGYLILNRLIFLTTSIHLLFYLGYYGYFWFRTKFNLQQKHK